MGYAEDAKENLARAKVVAGTSPILFAQVQATLALVEAVDGMSAQLDYLTGLVDSINNRPQ